MLYKALLTFESVDKILKCYHSNVSYGAVLSCGRAVYYTAGCKFQCMDEAVQYSTFLWLCMFAMVYSVALIYWCRIELPKLWAVLPYAYDVIHYASGVREDVFRCCIARWCSRRVKQERRLEYFDFFLLYSWFNIVAGVFHKYLGGIFWIVWRKALLVLVLNTVLFRQQKRILTYAHFLSSDFKATN